MAAALSVVGVLALVAMAAFAWRSKQRASRKFLDDLQPFQGTAITLALVTRQSQGLTRLLEVPCQLISISPQAVTIEPQQPLPNSVPRTAASQEGVVVVPWRVVAFADTPGGRVSATGWDATVDVASSEPSSDRAVPRSKAAGRGAWFGPGSPMRIAFVALCVVLGVALGLFLPLSSLTFRIVGTAALVGVVFYLSRRYRS